VAVTTGGSSQYTWIAIGVLVVAIAIAGFVIARKR
jgi:LPXTG-motif cell wall-anchored protein